MIQFRKSALAAGLVGLSALLAAPVQAARIDLIKIGIWDGLGAGTQDAGLQPGGRYVVKTSYDPVLTPTTPEVIGGLTFHVIDLDAAATALGDDSFELLVPMEGFDSGGTPFIYTQTQANHFPFFRPTPQIQFSAPGGSPADFVHFEYEGDLVAGAGDNAVSLFTDVLPAGSPPVPTIFRNTLALNFDGGPVDVAASQTPLMDAVPLVVDAGPNRTYSATTLSVTTDAASLQDNGLGASRLDGEDFLNFDWSESGAPLVGTPAPGTRLVDGAPADDVNITVALQDAGLATTVDTAIWTVDMSEDLTGLGGASDALTVDYLNSAPNITTAQATPAGVGGDDLLFELAFGDDDLSVGALIGILDFELLSVEILVDLIDQTLFFDPLITTGSQPVTNAQLVSQFGVGIHAFQVTVTDRAGGIALASFDFEVLQGQGPAPVPAPATLLLLGTGLVGLGAFRRRRTNRG